MSNSLKISSKGQISIPIEIRKRLGVKPGDRVVIVDEEGKQVIRPSHPDENPFGRFAGCLPAFESMEEINSWVRDMRGHEPQTRSRVPVSLRPSQIPGPAKIAATSPP